MSEPAVEPQRRPLRPPAPVPAPAGLPRPASEVVRAPGAGEPIPVEIRDRVGRSLGVDLRLVHVHADARSHEAAASVGARAFAFGTHIFLGPGERRTDVDLIAHEAAHVVQQQGAPALQLYAGASDRYEQEASRAQHAVRGGQTFRVAGRTSAAVVQRQDRPGLLQRGWGAITGAVSAGVEAVTDIGWSLLRRFAPELEPIIRQGIFEWLKERIVSAIQSVYDTLTAPIRTVFEFLDFLHSHFRQLVDWMREAAGKIARGDCSSIQEAAQKVHDVLAGIGHAVLDRVKAAAARVGAFFQRLWDRFGAPVWDFLRSVGGAIWERIQSFAAWVWEKTQPIRDAAARAWTWVKNQLGVGEGPEGQNGLLQWVQRKAGEAWDWLKARLEAYKRPLMVVGGILLMLSPAGPIIALGAGIGGLIYGVRWLAQHLRSHDAVVSQRGVLEGTIIPAIQRATNAVVAGISRAAAWLTEKLGAVAGAIGSAAGAIAGSIFSFLASAANWLLDKFRSLLSWATEKVHGLAQWAGDALSRLRTFLEPVIDVLRRFGRVITNLLEIAQLVVTRVWNAIPACIKDPIVNFLVNQILRRIPIFASLLQIPDIWSRIRTFAMTVIQQVFRDGNLAGAAMTVFRFLLDLLRVPVQLVVGIFQKASAALDLIVARPIDFLRNVLLALKDGFLGFVRNIGRHLLSGIVRWLTSTLAEAGVTVPTEWTFGSVFRFVLDVLGITLERVLEILARKVGQPIVDRIRSVIRFLTGAWEFVSVFIREGVGGLWRYVQQRISDLWENVKSAIVGWISQTLIGRLLARLATMLDPSGIGAVVNSIITVYRAIESAIEYVRGILEIVDRWMDMLVGLARGALGAAAERFEDLLDRALPIAIGFLANQVGLRNLGTRIREMIEVVRERVAQAIEWLIDQALRIGRAILERLGLGGARAGARVDFVAGGERHEMWVESDGDVKMATRETTIRDLLDHFEERVEDIHDPSVRGAAAQQEANGRLRNQVRSIVSAARNNLRTDFGDRRVLQTLDDATVTGRLRRLQSSLERLLDLFLRYGRPRNEAGTGGGMSCNVRITVVVPPGQEALTTRQYTTASAAAGGAPLAAPVTAPVGVRPEVAPRTTTTGREVFPIDTPELERARPERVGGVVIGPAPPPPGAAPTPPGQERRETVDVRTWATGDAVRNTESHAERQFAEWFAGQPQEWKQRIRRVEVHNLPLSPCRDCNISLLRVIRDPGLSGLRIALLFWTTPFVEDVDPQRAAVATTEASLRELVSAGWIVTPGPGAFTSMLARRPT